LLLVKEAEAEIASEERIFEIVFHNLGLRSWIECNLCWDCPRGDAKGCCYYNPTYYPTDLAYLQAVNPEAIKAIFSLSRFTVLEKYMSADRIKDPDGDFRCPFHSLEGGCRWAPELRESVCRFYVCTGCNLWEEEGVEGWKEFFDRLETYEAEINQAISQELEAQGLNLKSDPAKFIQRALLLFKEKWDLVPEWCREYPQQQRFILKRPISRGKEWKL
jgi:hypothetical protein